MAKCPFTWAWSPVYFTQRVKQGAFDSLGKEKEKQGVRMSAEISRRNFVAGAAGAAAISAAGIAQAATAVADEGVTSDGIRTAEAVPSWLGEKPAIADSDVIEEADYEILVCGSGMSGCFCASFAAEGGADVL